MFSVITINYNNVDGLSKTIASVLSQVNKDYEFIIIDGGSTDGSLDVINKSADKLSYWVSEKDTGPFQAMNKGVRRAKGEYCIFMNSGDSFYDNYVLEIFSKEKKTKDIYVGISAEHINGSVRMWYPMEESELSMRKLYRGSISHQASFIKTALLKSARYDESLKIVSDWKFYVETLIIKNVSYDSLPFIVANYMDGGISRNEDSAFAERELALKQLFSVRQLRDYHYMQYGFSDWDKLAKRVDPASKIGKIIVILVGLLLKLRK